MTSERRKEIRKKRRRKKQMKITQWFKKLSTKQKVLLISGIVLLLIMLAGIIYVASIFGKLDTQEIKEEEIFINEELANSSVGVGYTNFVLFGSDSRSGNVTKNLNTDTIIIVSLNNETKEVKMVSVYRDTLLDMTNGKIKKCNSAYSSGGAKQAINMLNMNLDLDIKKYVTVDFGAVSDLVDMVGGVEVDVTKAEMKEMNKFIGETANVANKKANYIKKAGLQTLDGVQATTYARIRKGVGDDYARTERQRLVIQKVVEKAMKSNWSTINKIIDELFPRISTNFSMTEVLSYAKDFAKYQFGETSGFPFVKGSGTIPGRGSCVFPMTLKSNVSELHAFLFGTEDYQPSSKVVEISGEIAYIVGNRKPDKDTSSSSGGDVTTGDDTTGGDTTGGDTTGGDTTGGDTTGGDTTGGDTTGGDTTGGDTTGGDTTGGDTTGGDTTGGDTTGGDTTGGDTTGGDTTGGDTIGGDTTGGDTTGGDTTGGDTTGGDTTGGDTTGGDTTGDITGGDTAGGDGANP